MTAPKAPLTAKDLADQIGIDAKALRVYLRATSTPKDEETGRYAFTAAQAKKHVAAYPQWADDRRRARKEATEAKAATQEAEEVADDE